MKQQKSIADKVVYIVAIVFCLFHLYVGWFGIDAIEYLRAIHLMGCGVIIFLTKPFSKKHSGPLSTVLNVLLIAVLVASTSYIVFNLFEITSTLGTISELELVLGIGLILVVLEATRRCVGLAIPCIAIVFMLYALFGPYFGPLANKAYSIRRLVSQLYFTTDGIFGSPLGVSASYVFLFILFGDFISQFGGADFFLSISKRLGRKRRSGPALTSIIGGALFGMISGSAVAIVSTVGGITIPAMKKTGYKPEVAASVNAISGTGGQLAPPVMGAAAFVMAELLGIPYLTIIKHAAIPAILYYFSMLMFVELYANHANIPFPEKEGEKSFRALMRDGGYTFVFPVLCLFFMMFLNFSSSRAAVAAIVVTVLVGCCIKENRQAGILKKCVEAFQKGAKEAVSVALTCACAGIIVGVVNLTGLGVKISSFILTVSGGNLLLTLFLIMVTCLIMGMGLPTTASYILVATMSVPTLTELGVPALASHMFIFYFAVISNITPPVCLASFAAANIAGTKPMKTGLMATWHAAITYIIPYLFVYRPAVIAAGSFLEILLTFICMVIGIVGISAAREGFNVAPIGIPVRIIMLLAGIAAIWPGAAIVNLVGCAWIVVYSLLEKQRLRRQTAA